MGAIPARDVLEVSPAKASRTQPAVAAAATRAVAAIDTHIAWVNFYGTLFRGLSTSSVLLVVAVGLAITFGVMGVINMAHGELIVVGAYTTYITQNLFGPGMELSPFGFSLRLPGLHAGGWFYQTYFLVALPLELPHRRRGWDWSSSVASSGFCTAARWKVCSRPGASRWFCSNFSAWSSARTTCRSIAPPG